MSAMGSISTLPWFNEAKGQKESPVLEMLRLYMDHPESWKIIPSRLASESPQLFLFYAGDSPTHLVVPEQLKISYGFFSQNESFPHFNIRVDYFKRNGCPGSRERRLYQKQFSFREIADRIQITLKEIQEVALAREKELQPLFKDIPPLEKSPGFAQGLSFSVINNNHLEGNSDHRTELCVSETVPNRSMIYSVNGKLSVIHHSLDDIDFASRASLLAKRIYQETSDPAWHEPLQARLTERWYASRVIHVLKNIPPAPYHDHPVNSEFFPATRLRLNPAPEKDSKILKFS
jgi:hypothetical protein